MAVGVLATALTGAVLMRKTYVGETLIQLKFSGDAATPGNPGGVTTEASAVVESEAEIIRSSAIARRVLGRLDREGVPVEPAGLWAAFGGAATLPASSADPAEADRRLRALQDRLSVTNDGKTYLIHVAYAAHDPVVAARVANAFADEDLKSRAEVGLAAGRRTSAWLGAQVEQAKALRQQAEEKVRAFRELPDVIAADGGDSQARDQQIRDLVGQISAAQGDRMRLENRLQRLSQAAAAGEVPSAIDLQGSPDAQRLIDAEVTARQDAVRLASTVGTKHPLYARALKTLDDARHLLADAVTAAVGTTRSDLDGARASEQGLAAQLDTLKKAALDAAAVGDQLKGLEADQANAKADVERLREAHRQAMALGELEPVTAQVVSPAEPVAIPTSPRLKLVALLGGLGGLGAGLGVAFLLQLRDTGYLSGAQAAGDLGIPCAGAVPALGSGDGPAALRLRDQALQGVAISTGLVEPRPGCTVVVVTSALPGEGKGDLVRSLAATLRAFGRRVLVVERTRQDQPDGDPRPDETPVVPGALATPHRTAADLVEVLTRRERFQPWIAEAGAHYDVVPVEAAGVLADVRTLMVARAADLVLFAVRWNLTPRAVAATAFRQLTPMPGQEAMVVLTGLDLDAHRRLGLRDSLSFARRCATTRRAPA